MPLKNLLHASFLVTLKGQNRDPCTEAMRESRGGGGGGGVQGVRNTTEKTSSIEKSNWAPSPWKRLDPLTFLTHYLDSGKIIVSLK